MSAPKVSHPNRCIYGRLASRFIRGAGSLQKPDSTHDSSFLRYHLLMLGAFRQSLSEKGTLDLVIRVRPQAARTQLQSVLGDQSLKIDIAAPAEDNRGNLALIRFLADEFSVSSGNIKILSGKTGRMKLVRITADR